MDSESAQSHLQAAAPSLEDSERWLPDSEQTEPTVTKTLTIG